MASAVVDVIIPTRNRAALTIEAVQSVQRQTFSDWRLYLVDDASDDETALSRILESTAEDTRIAVVERSTQGGPAAARQTGLRSGEAPYVATLDSDDLWKPEKLERQIDVLDRWMRLHPEVVGCFGLHIWSHYSARRVRILKHEAGRETLVRNPLCSSNMSSPLFLRGSLEDAGGFLPSNGLRLSTAEGIELFTRLTSRGPLVKHGDLLTECRTHDGSRASDTMSDLIGARELAMIVDMHADWLRQWPDDMAFLHARVGARFLGASQSDEGYAHLQATWLAAPWATRARLVRTYGPFVLKETARHLARKLASKANT